MINSDSTRYEFEFPSKEGHADETSPLSHDQKSLIDDVEDNDDPKRRLDLAITNDEDAGLYGASIGGREIGGIVYTRVGDRIVLQAASVHPDFRHQGVATELIRHVLDEVRAQGKTTTILCPIVRTFIENHPGYTDLVDPVHPGVVRTTRR